MCAFYQSPSYHHISPITRSTSGTVSHLSSAPKLNRSNSYTRSSSTFTMPSYGYGGGYMSKSILKSGSSLFGRSLSSTALNKTPPMHNVGVQRNTPHFSDKYPYVRYSYGNTETGLALLTQTEMKSSNLYGIRDVGTKRWLEGRVNLYNTGLFTKPNYKNYVERPITPVRNYVRYMPITDAVDMYKNKYLTVGTLSKYWLSSLTRTQHRNLNLNSSMYGTVRSFSSQSSRTQIPYYSKVANKLY